MADKDPGDSDNILFFVIIPKEVWSNTVITDGER